MTKEFNRHEEIEPYYDVRTETYIFKENDYLIDIKLNFELNIDVNIEARNITALNISAWNITGLNIDAQNIEARDIKAVNITACNIYAHNIDARAIDALNIDACDINFYSFCIAYENINCTSIKGHRENHIAKALDGEIIIRDERDELEHNQNQKAIECLKEVLEHFIYRPTYLDNARLEYTIGDEDKKFIDFVNTKIKELEGESKC